MATPVPASRVRIAGAGFTLFMFNGQPIAFCQQVQHTSPRPIAQPSFIQPMDEPYVTEILVPPAAGPGTLVLQLYELFGSSGKASKVWDRLGGSVGNGGATPFGVSDPSNSWANLTPAFGSFAGAVDIVDIFIAQAQLTPDKMQVTKIVRPLSAGDQAKAYTEDYIGCMITDVADGETVQVGTAELTKQITVTYRYLQRDGKNSQAYNQRNGQTIGPATFGAPI